MGIKIIVFKEIDSRKILLVIDSNSFWRTLRAFVRWFCEMILKRERKRIDLKYTCVFVFNLDEKFIIKS